ncbi:MAG: acyltransferase [Candidatus Ventricola sp.]
MDNRQVLQTASVKATRHYGIDLLRILSMFSIVLLHILGQGGVGQAVELYSKNYYAYLSLRFLNEFAVDAYGMISGYVMYKSRPKPSRLLTLWFEVLFYSAGISVLFILFHRSSVPVLRAEFYSMLLPITGGRYWYMSCYFCMFLLIPVLNAGVEKLTLAEMRSMLLGLFLLVCVLGGLNISRKDPFCMNYGFSTAWLCILYLAGAFCRKYQIHTYIRPWQSLLVIAICVLSTVMFKSWMDHNRWRLPYTLDWMLMSNVSITYTLTAFFMLNLFARVRPSKTAQRFIAMLSPLSLGVYLIHVHPFIWDNFITSRFALLANAHWLSMLFKSVAIALSIFVVCLGIDLIRVHIFQLLHIEQLCQRMEQLLLSCQQILLPHPEK